MWARRKARIIGLDRADEAQYRHALEYFSVLPQPTTVALYRQYGQRTQLWAGQATSASALVHAAIR